MSTKVQPKSQSGVQDNSNKPNEVSDSLFSRSYSTNTYLIGGAVVVATGIVLAILYSKSNSGGIQTGLSGHDVTQTMTIGK